MPGELGYVLLIFGIYLAMLAVAGLGWLAQIWQERRGRK